MSTFRGMIFNPHLSLCTKLNSKKIKELDRKPDNETARSKGREFRTTDSTGKDYLHRIPFV